MSLFSSFVPLLVSFVGFCPSLRSSVPCLLVKSLIFISPFSSNISACVRETSLNAELVMTFAASSFLPITIGNCFTSRVVWVISRTKFLTFGCSDRSFACCFHCSPRFLKLGM